MPAYLRPAIYSKARSRLAFWLVLGAGGLGVLCWFLIMNRAPVEVYLPFGQGRWNSSLAVVILASMAIGSAWTLLVQAIMAARKKVRKLYQAWNRPRTDSGHRSETPHIVSSQRSPVPRPLAKIEFSDHSD